VRFGSFELDLRTGELVANEPGVDGAPPQKVLLREQPFQILRILVARRGGIVTRDEIKKVLWPNDTIVDFDRSINVAMAILRKAVGDTAENPRYIETLPRRGYRLIVPVQLESTTEPPKAEDRHTSAAELRKDLLPVRKELPPGIHLARSWLAIAAVILVLFTAAGVLYWRFHSRITLSSSDTLVLADVNNQTGDAALDDGMNLALQVALQQTPYLNLLGSDKVHETLRLLRLSEDTPVTPAVALEICRKTNSRAVISAFIGDAGNRFRIELSAIDCQSGKTLEQMVHAAETREDIVRTLGSSTSQLRLKLGESTDSVRRFNQPLDQATSSSPDALQFLVLGYKKHLSGDIPGALAYYGRAIDKDPNFGLAYAALASGNATQAEAAETKVADSARHQIRIRAYEIYLERGEQPGRDLDDWLQAERELTTNHTGE
jgi:DNA-binding winged helix-turn-helix (wHTH) protein